ncbi:hypothetical protein LB503_001050 [Fusarium chuoi]|nr:hypothetical protein LB503_001050 [Fusarium chuoi]
MYIAVFVLQSLGCDVAALNTVQFSEYSCHLDRWSEIRNQVSNSGTSPAKATILDISNGRERESQHRRSWISGKD